MDFLKEILGEELYTQFSEKINASKNNPVAKEESKVLCVSEDSAPHNICKKTMNFVLLA